MLTALPFLIILQNAKCTDLKPSGNPESLPEILTKLNI